MTNAQPRYDYTLARQLADEGYGWEDLCVMVPGITRWVARIIVLGKGRK